MRCLCAHILHPHRASSVVSESRKKLNSRSFSGLASEGRADIEWKGKRTAGERANVARKRKERKAKMVQERTRWGGGEMKRDTILYEGRITHAPLIETSAGEWIKTARTEFVEISEACNLFSYTCIPFHSEWSTWMFCGSFFPKKKICLVSCVLISLLRVYIVVVTLTGNW